MNYMVRLMFPNELDDLHHKVVNNGMLVHVFELYQDQDGLYLDDHVFVSEKNRK